VDFSSNRQSLITAGHEGLLRIFDLATSTLVSEIPHYSSEKLTIIKTLWGADPHSVITGASNGTVKVWDTRSNIMMTQLSCSTKLVQDLELTSTPKGEVLTVASGNKVSFYHGRNFEQLECHEMPINFHEEGGASLHPSGNRFIAGGSDVWVRVFDRWTGKELECNKGHHGPV
jgi:serine-threonine kinase receptor-associated protein